MANKIVQLVDANDDNIFPLSSDPNAAHITMTSTDPGEGSALAANNYVAVYGGDPIILDYSLSEINTGAKWIDGSAIYKKTIDFGALPNATIKSVPHNISNLSAVIKIEGVCSRSDSWSTVPLMFNSGSAPFNTDFYVDGTYLNASSGQNVSNRTAYVTLYYTKSS